MSNEQKPAQGEFPPRIRVHLSDVSGRVLSGWPEPKATAFDGTLYLSLAEHEAIVENRLWSACNAEAEAKRERDAAREEAKAIISKEFDAWLDLIELDHRDILKKGLYKDPEESSYHYRSRVNLLSAVRASIDRALLKSNISPPNGYETQESGLNATRSGADLGGTEKDAPDGGAGTPEQRYQQWAESHPDNPERGEEGKS